MAEISISLTPRSKGQTAGGVELSPAPIDDVSMASGVADSVINTAGNAMAFNVSSLLTPAAIIAATKMAYDIAVKVRDKVIELENDKRSRNERLRELGGAGFSPNAVGQRYNIFTESYTGGTSVAYRRR